MVKVRDDYPLLEDGSVDIDGWIDRLQQQVNLKNVEDLKRACRLAKVVESEAVSAGDFWSENTTSFVTGLEMIQILAELQMDASSLIAAVLYRAVREEKLTLATVEKEFNAEVVHLISGVLQMAAISNIHQPYQGTVLGQAQTQVDNIRRMLVTMIDDVRVALIKLAERTCAIRDVKNASSEKRHRVAREVFDIYAPLAHRLGIGYLKWELEDLSFRYLHETAYKKIAKQLDERRVDRQRFIEDVLSVLRHELDQYGIKAELSGRAKHIYSIWRKMHRKGVDFSQIYDIRAIRILVPSVKDCYSALGLVHLLWRHIPHEFDDYVANPKQNGYQSLHTAVVGPHGKVMEVQIRTQKMHEEAELGVCAHWLYKGTDTLQKSYGYEQKIAWLRQVLEWQEELGAKTAELVEQWRNDIVSDRIYVFTPEGHVIDLPSGSTPLDFAYKVHTEVGHSCRGAKINGRIVPLTYVLKTGDQVAILTSGPARPSRDWLNPDLSYTVTSRARAKITHWFKLQDRDQNIEEGREILLEILKRLSLEKVPYEELAEKVNLTSAEDMFAAIGAGDLKPMQVAHMAQRMLEPKEHQLTLQLPAGPAEATKSGDVHILGVGNLLTQMAQCCKPLPGDPIVGYITIGRGVSIHRQDCMNILQLQSSEPNRIIEVSWGDSELTYPVEVIIDAYDRSGLLRDITILLANERVNVNSVNTHLDKKLNTARLQLTIEVTALDSLARVLDRIRRLPNIMEVRRAHPGEHHG